MSNGFAAVAFITALSVTAAWATAEQGKRMPDGKEWMTTNLNVSADGSYCFDNAESQCTRIGRLYTWESARQACERLGAGWRLPTKDEWQLLAAKYGGVGNEAPDGGKGAYAALITGGASGFNAVLGGAREPNGAYERLDAHGLYWTASETGPGSAVMLNFAKGSAALFRAEAAPKTRAGSVRCVRD